MVKTFNLCAPSLSQEGSAFKPISEFFANAEFPIRLTVRNRCPFALIIPSAGIELAHVSSDESVGTFEIKCHDQLMGLVSSVEQIAELNRIVHGATICYAVADEIEEPAAPAAEAEADADAPEAAETVESTEEEPAEAVETVEAVAPRRRGRPSRKTANT